MKLSFPTRKLKGSIRKAGVKVAKLDIDAKKFTVFGVSKVNGVSVTGKDVGKNLEGYYFFEGQKFAYNPYRINIGSIGLSEDSFSGLMSSAYVIFETDNSINNEFLLLYLKSALGINLIKWYGDRGGVRSALRFSDLEKIDFPKLSYKQQTQALHKIKAKQSIVDDLLFELNSQQKLIKKLRQSILQDAFKGELTKNWRKSNPNSEPDYNFIIHLKQEESLTTIGKDEMPFEIPKSWKWCQLIDIIQEKPRNGFSPKGSVNKTSTKSLKLGATTKGVFDPKEIKYLDVKIPKDSHLWLLPGDILIQRSNSIDYVGVSAIYDGKAFDFVYPDLMMKIRPIQPITSNYLYFALSSPTVRKYLKDRASGTSSNMPKINQPTVSSIPIPICSKEEQQVIESKVGDSMKLCDQLDAQIALSKRKGEQLMQAALQEAFNPSIYKDDIIRELIPNIDKYAQVAMATLKIENELKYNYGKVEKQKTGFLLQAIKKQPVPYTFEKSNFGTFSWELSNDLDTNPYLRKTRAGQGEVYEVKASKHQEVLSLLNAPENASFVQAVDELIQVYKMPLVNAKTDQIELLNTVCKSILDTQSTELDTIYGYMEFWTIKQEGFNTKAEKFSRPETDKMLELVLKLGWDKELIAQ